MIRNLYLLVIACFPVLFFSCKEEDVTPSFDKEVRLTFPYEYWSTNQTQLELLPSYSHLVKFNKTDYSNLDSIIFYSSIATESLDNTAELELFNVTDNVSIGNTTIQASTDFLKYTLIKSGNIKNELPNKEIDIAIRLKSKNGKYVYVRSSFLLLKRK